MIPLILVVVGAGCPAVTDGIDAGAGGGGSEAGGGTATGGGAATTIGACASVTLDGVRPLVPQCVDSLPSEGLGSTITAGTYRLTGVLLSPRYTVDAGTGTCTPGSPSSLFTALRMRIAPTSTAGRYDYEAVRGYALPDGGSLVEPGSERGTALVSPDGLSMAFLDVTCSDAGTNGVLSTGGLFRVFKASAATFQFDCCRSTVVDGGAPLDAWSYMMEFTRE